MGTLAFAIIGLLLAVLGAILATYLNRRTAARLEQIRSAVRNDLSTRSELSLDDLLADTDALRLSHERAVILVTLVAGVLGVEAGKLRLDDRLEDYFYGPPSFRNGVGHDERIAAHFDDLYYRLGKALDPAKRHLAAKDGLNLSDEDNIFQKLRTLTLGEMIRIMAPLLRRSESSP